MKCPKCNAQNINEATKCGVCGKRLKYTPSQSSMTIYQRPTSKAVNTYKTAQIPKQSKPAKAKTLRIIFLSLGMFAAINLLVIFLVKGFIGNNLPFITDKFKLIFASSESAEEYTLSDSEEVHAAIEESEMAEKMNIIRQIEPDVEFFYQKRGRLPSSLQEIEQQLDIEYSDYVLSHFSLKNNGVIRADFPDMPEQKVYSQPTVKNPTGEFVWQCYQINIQNDDFPECEYTELDLFK